jgi:uncharacterized tellurite resistance protein B-like protein
MLDLIRSFLAELQGTPRRKSGDLDDPRVAAAALMFHVIDADGVRDDGERAKMRDLVSEAYSVQGSELDELIATAEEAEREAVDLYAFTSVLMRDLGPEARLQFIRILWEMVYADGEIHELEDNVVWRIAELIGVDSRDRVAMRQKVQSNLRSRENSSN